MIRKWVVLMAFFAAGLGIVSTADAASVEGLEHARIDLGDRASLQRGAKLFMNYCSGCHSLKHLRYTRMAEDLGLTEEEVRQNLLFTDTDNLGEHIISSLRPEDGAAWFGKAPPDLSVTARVRGDDWIFTYLKSFYIDGTRPLGWNNTVFDAASMPNPLWELQGVKVPIYGDFNPETGETPITEFVPLLQGSQDDETFDQTVRDITNFLAYAAEPAGLKRQKMGIWVLLFCVVLTFVAYLLKKEYWKDVEH